VILLFSVKNEGHTLSIMQTIMQTLPGKISLKIDSEYGISSSLDLCEWSY